VDADLAIAKKKIVFSAAHDEGASGSPAFSLERIWTGKAYTTANFRTAKRYVTYV
jgi:hypothetical protein